MIGLITSVIMIWYGIFRSLESDTEFDKSMWITFAIVGAFGYLREILSIL